MNEQTSKKEALKALRQARQATIAAAAERLKVQRQAIAAIKTELKRGDRTVPELAAATGLPTADVLWYIAALKKYGEILEGDKDGNYFRYHLAAGGPA